MKYYPCAKINLGLNVVARRADGYHDLETVFFPVGVYDELDVVPAGGKGCRLEVKGVRELCSPEKNLVVKAYNLLNEYYDLPGMYVTLVKNIPSQAGMGGGSSDGAFMLRAINELCSLNIPQEEMQGLAARLGADCPFFINPEVTYAEGIGDRLSPIGLGGDDLLKDCYLVLIKPNVSVSTKEAYAGITPRKPEKNCKDVVTTMPVSEWRNHLTNDFEESIFSRLPILKEVKETLYEAGALYAAMSGSGSTIYGIFPKGMDSREIMQNNNISIYADKYYFKIIEEQK